MHKTCPMAPIQIPVPDERTTAVTVDDTNLRVVEGLDRGAVQIRDAATFAHVDTFE